jgi:hypothetical protein
MRLIQGLEVKCFRHMQCLCKKSFRMVHASDFRNAVGELGLTIGSKPVQNVLVSCKLDNGGNIDFSALEAELARERSVFNAENSIKPKLATIPTSSAALNTPWRNDVIHEQKISSELQSKRCV